MILCLYVLPYVAGLTLIIIVYLTTELTLILVYLTTPEMAYCQWKQVDNT